MTQTNARRTRFEYVLVHAPNNPLAMQSYHQPYEYSVGTVLELDHENVEDVQLLELYPSPGILKKVYKIYLYSRAIAAIGSELARQISGQVPKVPSLHTTMAMAMAIAIAVTKKRNWDGSRAREAGLYWIEKRCYLVYMLFSNKRNAT